MSNNTSHRFSGISLAAFATLAILLVPMFTLEARQTKPLQVPNKPSTDKPRQGSTLKPNSVQKSPIQFEAELDEIMAIREKLGGGVAEQLKGLNLQLDPTKAKQTVDQAAPDFRELLKARQAFEAVQKDLMEAQTAAADPQKPRKEPEEWNPTIPRGHKVISVKVPPEDAMQGLMKVGDFVDVIGDNRTVAKAARVFNLNQKKSVVSLLAKESDAQVIVNAHSNGQIRLAWLGNKDPGVVSTVALESPVGTKHTNHSQQTQTRRPSSPQLSRPSTAIRASSTRTRNAARMVEQAAAELEEAGQYELADQLRKNAQKIWESAR